MAKKIRYKSRKVNDILKIDNFINLRYCLNFTHPNGRKSLNYNSTSYYRSTCDRSSWDISNHDKGRCQKHPEGGELKFVTKGRQTLTPPKNSYKDMYPPLNLQQQLRPSLNFRIKTWIRQK